MRVFFVAVFLLVSQFVWAQEVRLTGRLIDAKNQTPIGFANVVWMYAGDSSVLATTSDEKGSFDFLVKTEKGNKGWLSVSYMGYKTWVKEMELDKNTPKIDLATVKLSEDDSLTLTEVVVKEQVLPSVQKGDTTQFNANAFKVNPDANTEDLIRKMPGVTMENGKLQAQGEDVKQVLVDGKPFFGNDPNAALKNLPADVVAQVQVFDQQSMGGFGNGNTTKTINIITKPTMRDGVFGRVFAGYGASYDTLSGYAHRYKAGGNVNYFKGDRRLSVMAQSNNTNEQNFSTEDLLGVVSVNGSNQRGGGGGGRPGGHGGGRPGGYRPGGGGGDVSDFLVNDRTGIALTHAIGINYMDKLGKKKKWDLSASYFFNWSDNNANSTTYRQYILPSDSGQVYNENSLSKSHNMNQRFNMQLTWRIDSLNNIMIRPRISAQYNNGNSNTDGAFSNSEAALSSTSNAFGSKLWGINANNEIYYTRLFANRPGQMLTVSLTNSYNWNNGSNELLSLNQYPYDALILTDSINQQAQLNKNNWSVTLNTTYSQPVSKKSQLQFSYNGMFSRNLSDKQTYSFNHPTSDYTRLDTALSNQFDNYYHTESGGFSYRYNNKDFNLTATASYQWSRLESSQMFPTQSNIHRDFHTVLPSLMIRYNITKTKSWRLFYRTSTTSPSIDQLQNVVVNNNPLQLTTGNPNLQQTYDQRLFTRYSASNTEKGTTFFAMIGGTFTHNYIGNNTIIANQDTTLFGNIPLTSGAQITQPMNFKEGQLWARTFMSFGLPIKKIKTNFNANVFANYTRTPGLINGGLNLSHTPNVGLGVTFSSNISENIDFTLSSNSNLTFVLNTLQTYNNSQFFTQNTEFKFNWIFWKGFLFNTAVNYQVNAGLSESFNTQFVLWSLSIGKKFLKNNAAELRFTTFDVLNQNTQVQRTTTETYLQDQRSNVLNRYYMLTFSYNIKKFKEETKPKE